MCRIESESQVLASCHFDRSVPPLRDFYFERWHAITVSGFISSQTVIVRDVSTHSTSLRARLSVDMTELRSTATSRILLPMKLRHSLVREEVHWPSRRSPASGGLRAGSQSPSARR